MQLYIYFIEEEAIHHPLLCNFPQVSRKKLLKKFGAEAEGIKTISETHWGSEMANRRKKGIQRWLDIIASIPKKDVKEPNNASGQLKRQLASWVEVNSTRINPLS